ncbi:hypothetical protein FACS189472_15160 [Alphaproteobacteria bacterium]|nr:hypothetical protein FACS189472_15160 [Alphaproteobacteria bacterium]
MRQKELQFFDVKMEQLMTRVSGQDGLIKKVEDLLDFKKAQDSENHEIEQRMKGIDICQKSITDMKKELETLKKVKKAKIEGVPKEEIQSMITSSLSKYLTTESVTTLTRDIRKLSEATNTKLQEYINEKNTDIEEEKQNIKNLQQEVTNIKRNIEQIQKNKEDLQAEIRKLKILQREQRT